MSHDSRSPGIQIDFARKRKGAIAVQKASLLSWQTRTMTFLRRGCKTFPNIGLTYRLENSTTSKQPIRIRITRNIPRDVRLLTAFVRSNGDGHENTHETKAKAWTKQHEIKKETRKDSCNCCGYGMEILYVKFAFLKESS